MSIATEGPKTAGVSAEIAAIVAEEGFDLLDAPILRITSLDTPVPLASIAERYVLPMRGRYPAWPLCKSSGIEGSREAQ